MVPPAWPVKLSTGSVVSGVAERRVRHETKKWDKKLLKSRSDGGSAPEPTHVGLQTPALSHSACCYIVECVSSAVSISASLLMETQKIVLPQGTGSLFT